MDDFPAISSFGEDARDAAIIAEAARTMPHTLRAIALDDETLAELGVLCGFDDDLAAQITASSNRIRGLLTQIHPALERALGPHIDHPAVAALLTRYPTPAALKTAGRGHVRARLKKHAPGAAERLTDAVFAALGEQSVVVVGTNAAGVVLPKLVGLGERLLGRWVARSGRAWWILRSPHEGKRGHLSWSVSAGRTRRRDGNELLGKAAAFFASKQQNQNASS